MLPLKSKAKPNGKKPAAEEKKVYLEPEYTKSRITDFGFKELVVLPREIDLNEWLASNTTTFFHHVNLQYSTISEFCTGEACQTMAVCNTQYYWYDERGKKVKCTAPQYVDFVMSSVQKLVTDEDVFPTKYGREFPSSFESLVKKICKYLFHVLAHIYSSHFKETLALELHGHLNTLYVHFILFAREFNLLDPKETAVMDDLTEVLCSGGGVRAGCSGPRCLGGRPGPSLGRGYKEHVASLLGCNKKNSLRSAPLCVLSVSVTLGEAGLATPRWPAAALLPPPTPPHAWGLEASLTDAVLANGRCRRSCRVWNASTEGGRLRAGLCFVS
uniref:MOB kinase activator 2 n=1 Tax=Sus scrofa TaxID=9823 RepID=A0A8D0UD45_PIG